MIVIGAILALVAVTAFAEQELDGVLVVCRNPGQNAFGASVHGVVLHMTIRIAAVAGAKFSVECIEFFPEPDGIAAHVTYKVILVLCAAVLIDLSLQTDAVACRKSIGVLPQR